MDWTRDHRTIACPAPEGSSTMEAQLIQRMQNCEHWRAQLEAGENAYIVTDAVRGSVWDFACHPSGCRVVQLLLNLLPAKDAASLVMELHGHVVDAIMSPHANFVVQ